LWLKQFYKQQTVHITNTTLLHVSAIGFSHLQAVSVRQDVHSLVTQLRSVLYVS